jgi:hypothetical protein
MLTSQGKEWHEFNELVDPTSNFPKKDVSIRLNARDLDCVRLFFGSCSLPK